ncbi:protein DOWNY MILDEW RESISTANCE 6-like [Senna tora]|uniref:Protein DOWNY MILDEW RESISTANCE 6-like n=1 Tax=Senna tora TaxID=362788 RepID=A0A834XGJ0_9FABA|nr:protein DOWNY MILDEW RESISTANCE 6-like [Senna tora]
MLPRCFQRPQRHRLQYRVQTKMQNATSLQTLGEFKEPVCLSSRSPFIECVGTCSNEINKLGSRILRLISEGLGLNSDYFDGELSGSVILSVNHYLPHPEPSLTLRVSKHPDPNLITILLQDDVYGLQVLKDDSWISVDPNPRAFVINIINQLQRTLFKYTRNDALLIGLGFTILGIGLKSEFEITKQYHSLALLHFLKSN